MSKAKTQYKHKIFTIIILVGSIMFVCGKTDWKGLLLFFTVPITLWHFLGLFMYKLVNINRRLNKHNNYPDEE